MPSAIISTFTAAKLTSATAIKALMVMERMIKALLVARTGTEAADPPAAPLSCPLPLSAPSLPRN